MEVDHHLFCLTDVYPVVVPTAPFDKVGDDNPVFQFVPFLYTSNKACVNGELLEVTVVGVVSNVYNVKRKREGSPCTVGYHNRHSVTKSHILRSVN